MPAQRLADDVEQLGTATKNVDVQVSYEVVKLFSEQLYSTPIKAIEELVVNSWDAEASVCSVKVDLDGERPLIVVFDNGKGMTLQELENLWHIGISNKLALVSKRTQIGKFGIGKLASYAVARRATYISRSAEGIHAVSINFDVFAEATNATGVARPVTLTLRKIDSISLLNDSRSFKAATDVLLTGHATLDLEHITAWTLVVLEDLKEKAHQLATGRLKWVLETAMPLASDFALYLNGTHVVSSKERYEKVVAFTVDELEDERIEDLSPVTGETWTKVPKGLNSPSFPSGVTGDVYVTKKSLYAEGGKSEDLGRSHGFFVRVHNRLINETDPLFGARPLSFKTWYRFAAIVEAPDLNEYVTASRDDVEQSQMKKKLRELLIQLFNQARDRHEEQAKAREEENRRQKEGTRDYVSTELVERPLADALVASGAGSPPEGPGTTPSATWRFIEPVIGLVELQALVGHLYSTERKGQRYTFKYSPSGELQPLVRLNPTTATFVVNEDHELAREYADKPDSKRLLEAVVVAETLLEVYLYGAGVEPEIISELLERRDILMRSLALDESYSLQALAASLRAAADGSHDLEVALIGALRPLGFSARHIGGSGTPDGVASYLIHGLENTRLTLEAKSSGSVPTLAHLDFAGLHSHYEKNGAQGCLLVAPAYPGAEDPDSEVSIRAREQKVSCWTIDLLANVVENAERRQLNARHVQEIVLGFFAPAEVAARVQRLLSEPSFDSVDLYQGIIQAIADLEPRLSSTPRNIFLLAGEISRLDRFKLVELSDVERALGDLARASKGMLHVTDKQEVFVLGTLDELRRRVASLTGEVGEPRRLGTFRAEPN
jgi:hypothetical protein